MQCYTEYVIAYSSVLDRNKLFWHEQRLMEDKINLISQQILAFEQRLDIFELLLDNMSRKAAK